MFIPKIKFLAILLVAGLVVSGCSFGPPPSCGDNIGGTADTARFDQYFANMQLVSQASGQPGPEGESGAQFSAGEALTIQVESKSDVAVRACVQPRGPGEITFDQTQTLPQGQGSFSVDTFKPGPYVIRVLEMLIAWRGCLNQIRMDNEPELISHRLEQWATERKIVLAHIQPGKPAQNAYIERFNRTFREDVLDAYLFSAINEIREIAEQWLEEYNAIRPHEALQGLSPYQYAAELA